MPARATETARVVCEMPEPISLRQRGGEPDGFAFGPCLVLRGAMLRDVYFLARQGFLAHKAIRGREHRPVDPRHLEVVDVLAAAWRIDRELSGARHRDVEHTDLEEASEPDEPIGIATAAALLGLSRRQTQRLAWRLDGRKAGNVWVFDRSTVERYASVRSEQYAQQQH